MTNLPLSVSRLVDLFLGSEHIADWRDHFDIEPFTEVQGDVKVGRLGRGELPALAVEVVDGELETNPIGYQVNGMLGFDVAFIWRNTDDVPRREKRVLLLNAVVSALRSDPTLSGSCRAVKVNHYEFLTAANDSKVDVARMQIELWASL